MMSILIWATIIILEEEYIAPSLELSYLKRDDPFSLRFLVPVDDCVETRFRYRESLHMYYISKNTEMNAWACRLTGLTCPWDRSI